VPARYRFLATPRWLSFALLVVIMAVVCVGLGRWQLHRLDERRALNARLEAALSRPPVPVDALLAPGQPLPADLEWRTATATGRYAADQQLLVRNRTQDGRPGLHVLTPLVDAGGTAILVDRGWIPAGASATERVEAPAPPAGEVVVTGRLRASQGESARAGDITAGMPPGQIPRIDVPGVANMLGQRVYGGFLERVTEKPSAQPAPEPVPPPELGEGPHLAYAMQWFLFALVAVVGWFVLVREEARGGRERRQAAARPRVPVGS